MADFGTIRGAVRASEREMVALQKILTAVPALAPECGGSGEMDKCLALEKWLSAAGFSELERFDSPDPRVPGGVRPNLVATVRGRRDDFSIWVMAHLDVVPPGDLSMWKTDPWTAMETADGRLVGRGVEDNQQGLVSAVFAALAFIRCGVVPERTVKLLFLADEECGSEHGVKFLLREHRGLFSPDDLILIPDGGDSDGSTVEVAEKGILWLRIHTVGVQSHGSMPDEGRNAHLAAAEIALALNALEGFFSERDPMFSPDRSTFQPTKREPNVDGVNMIPGDDVFYMDCRVLPRYPLAEVRAEIDRRVSEIALRRGVRVEVEEVQREESPATPADAPVVERLSRAIMAAHGKSARTVGIGGGTVGAHFRALGFGAAIWSSLDSVCHQPNEYCRVANMVADAETLAALFMQE